MFFRVDIILLLALLAVAPLTHGDENVALCGNPFAPPRGNGPYDYTNPAHRSNPLMIPMLERHHFNADVQSGRRGQSGPILNDLDFILRACPNHHRALYTLIQYHLRHDPVVPTMVSVGCYLNRAERFTPDDGYVHLLSGIYHARVDNRDAAVESYQRALELIPDSGELHYNLGLVYLEMGDREKANQHAVRAYSLGVQLPGLKRKLVRLKAWNPEAVVVPVSEAVEDE